MTSLRPTKSAALAAPASTPFPAREENPALCDHEYRGHFFDNLLRRLPKPAAARPATAIRAAA